jgi:HlyD family type I secretion membrane fusion protein
MSRSKEIAPHDQYAVEPLSLGSAPAFAEPLPLRREVRGSAVFGILIVVAFFGVFGGWAAMAPLSGAAIAPGTINPEGSRRTVQHLEGGIIRSLAIREGDQVAEGDMLLVLEDVGAGSELAAMRNRFVTLVAKEARLTAERKGTAEFTYDAKALDADARAAYEQQANEFKARRVADSTQAALLEQRSVQTLEQITGFQRQLVGIQKQRSLIREEIEIVGDMVAKGLDRKPRLLSLQRAEAEMTGTEGALMAQVARARENIAEVKLQAETFRTQRRETVERELAEAQELRTALEQRLKGQVDKVTRTAVRAPVSGVVINLRFKTIGGVVKAGEVVLDIVPDGDELVIDARVATKDIDDVRAGQSAFVTFPSLPQRNMQRINGLVAQVSADAFQDNRTGNMYYLAKIKVDRRHLEEAAPNIRLFAGMPAEVYITTVNRTVLEYLMQPVWQTVGRAFRES